MMQRWLEVRGQQVPGPHAHHMHGAMLMPGMLTAEEMERLARPEAPQFDRLFLEGMIKHHDGALTMVEELFSHRRRRPGVGHLRVRVRRRRRSADGNRSDGRHADRSCREMRAADVTVAVRRRAALLACVAGVGAQAAIRRRPRRSARRPQGRAARRRHRRAQHGAGRAACRSRTASSIPRRRPATPTPPERDPNAPAEPASRRRRRRRRSRRRRRRTA